MKIKGLRWWIITLIFIATVINYIDRTAFALLWPEMGKDLGMDKSDYAIMLNVFMACYAIGKFASGKLYDKIGTRLGFTVSIIIWSLASAFHAFARGIISLSIVRGLLGIGEAGNWPGAVKSNGEWFPIKERAIAQGIFNAGASIGNVIAPFIIVFLYTMFGWKTTYIILGLVGMLWVIPWLFLNKSTPEKHPWVTQEERELIVADRIEGELEDSENKDEGLSVKNQMYYAALSLNYYRQNPDNFDLTKEMIRLNNLYSNFEHIENTHFYANFGHLVGYSAMYYTYMWSLVIAADMFSDFDQNNLLDTTVANHYRQTILAPGGSEDADKLVTSFLGRPYSFTAFENKLKRN